MYCIVPYFKYGLYCIVPYYKSIVIQISTSEGKCLSIINRFITCSDWNPWEMNKVKMRMINEIESDGVVVLDDYIVEKYGKEIYGADWHYDHSKGRSVFGWQIADCVLSGKGIYPLLSSLHPNCRTACLCRGECHNNR